MSKNHTRAPAALAVTPACGRCTGNGFRHLCRAHAKIARKYKRLFSLRDRRVEDIEHLARCHYSDALPDDARGRRFVFALANHMRDATRIRIMISNYAPWYPEDDADDLIRRVERRPTKWSADSLAKFLKVTYAEHTKYRLGTIGAVDVPKQERKRRRQEKYRERKRALDRAWQAKQRRANGATPRAESASRTKPWLAAGFKTRRTWERHGKPVTQIRRAPTSSKVVSDESATRPWKGFPPLVVVSAQRPRPGGSESVDVVLHVTGGSDGLEVSSQTASMIWRAAERPSGRRAAAAGAAAPVRGGAPEPLSWASERLTWLNGNRWADAAAPINQRAW
jgi:hypothetical protein